MKRIIITFLILLMLSPVTVYASEITSNSDEPSFEASADAYIPDKVGEKLEENGILIESDSLMSTLLTLVLGSIKNSLNDMLPKIFIIMSIMIISATSAKIIDNSSFLKIIEFISTLFLLFELISLFNLVTKTVNSVLSEISEILTLVIPSFCSVLLLGGGNFSAMASSASLGAVLGFLKNILSEFLTPAVSVMFILIITEKLAPNFEQIKVSATIKKYFMMILSFTTTVMLTVISFQSILGASKDSISARTLKFTASNFIPVVGGAVSESLKTVGAGIKYLKNTVGISVALAIFSVVILPLSTLFSLKIILSLLSLSGGLIGASKAKEVIDSFLNIVDILNGIIICITVLSILVTVLFVITSFTVGVS